MSTPSNLFARHRLGFAFAGLVLLFTITFVASPTARAYAADFLHQIGVLTFSNRPVEEQVIIAPPSAEQMALASATATPIAPASQSGSPLEIARAQAGFQPYLPSYLPAGYAETEIVAAEYIDDWYVGYGMGIFATYRSPSGGYLAVQTTRFDERAQDIPMGEHAITEVRVNGQQGVWIEGLQTSLPQTTSATLNMLVWQENEFVVAIQTNQLSLEETLKIAGSLEQ